MCISICFEGGEGSGKGTIIKHLIAKLSSEGKNVVVAREPGGLKIGEEIRSIILDDKNTNMAPLTEAALFAASRAQLISEIIDPTLKNKEVDYLVLDRYVYSSYVYQGIVKNVGLDKVRRINNIATNGWHPDIVFYLDLDPTIGLKRIADNNRETNRFDKEGLDFHKKVREAYLQIARDEELIVIDANQSIEKVFEQVWKEITQWKKLR